MRRLADAPWLQEHLGEPDLRVVDCRFVLGEPGAGRRAWLAGHMPGAAFLDLDADLAGEPGERGRHPLPDPEAFESAARRAGIGAGSRVVAYDEAGEGGAARLWWLLRHYGHEEVAVLDGGLAAWRDGGGRCAPARSPWSQATSWPAHARATAWTPTRRAPRRCCSTPGRRSASAARSEPIDPVAGHIPGAVNLPSSELAPGGRFLDRRELRARLERAGAAPGREVVAYCGSGVTACTIVLAAELAGLGPARLYPGSWSEWSRGGRPVERSGAD